MNWIDSIGTIAGFLTTLSFVPQVLKGYRTRSVRDLSWAMLSAFSIGVVCWLLYGLALRAMPIIVTNAVTLLLTASLLMMKWVYRQ